MEEGVCSALEVWGVSQEEMGEVEHVVNELEVVHHQLVLGLEVWMALVEILVLGRQQVQQHK